MIRFVPLTPELMRWAVTGFGDDLARSLHTDTPELCARMLAGAGIAQAMVEDGEMLGVGGVTQHWPGRAEAWLLISPEATGRQRLAAVRRCQEEIAKVQRNTAFRRIEMYVLADAPWRERFSAILGFRQEGVAHAWDPLGRDYCLFARVMES